MWCTSPPMLEAQTPAITANATVLNWRTRLLRQRQLGPVSTEGWMPTIPNSTNRQKHDKIPCNPGAASKSLDAAAVWIASVRSSAVQAIYRPPQER